MAASRLTLALDGGDISLPETGRIAVFGPVAGMDISGIPAERTDVIATIKPDHDYFAGLGYRTATAPDGSYAAALVCVPRAKPLARAMVAAAASVAQGPIIVDGQKTDGVESLLREIRARVPVSTPLSKAHGKIFSFEASDAFDDWTAKAREIASGFRTMPGVFSADGIDPGSAMLAEALPEKLGAQVADLGGGWGFLSSEILKRDTVTALHLVEADFVALECARHNLDDPRLTLHWADVTAWQPPVHFDTVVTNPPFHTGRVADPSLGRAFVQAAAGMLKPGGQLLMVANRHLPYETTLTQVFQQIEEIAGNAKFKVLRAARPVRQRRAKSQTEH